MDRFQTLQVFAHVAQMGSFTKAAVALGISRAAVSVAVQRLETHLGARLVHRTTRRVHLTAEGLAFHERCLRILSELEEAEQLFAEVPRRLLGKLAIDAPTRIARRILVPALPEWLSRNPGLELRLGASDRSINLVEKGIDAVVHVGRLPDSSLVARHLGALRLVNCASPSYLARHGKPNALEDLDRHRIVHYSTTFAGSAEWEYVEGGAVRSMRMRSAVAVDNAETYIACGLAGLGLIQVPAYDVRHHLESGALVAVLPAYAAAPLGIAIVYPHRRQVPARVRAFTDWAAGLFERHGIIVSNS
ncbi:LysR family transcriptional regulator [Pendulispora albinea]|uniref:LysR family transcriptional regulator n=1 Tax=Pendulispora albinea TaxID=2741071 RepID=A0ABZ2LTM6_9BACT